MMATAPQINLAEDLAALTHDPLGAVLYGFPWGEGPLEGLRGPRRWQGEVFEYIGEHFRNPETRYKVCRVAISSGNGPGKSAFAAQLSWACTSTFEYCRTNVTANTKAQLDTKTSPEFQKWFGMALNADWFDVHVTSIKVDGHEANWRVDFLPWSESNPAATAGQHNARRRLLLIFDEASEINDVIFDTAEGALTDEDTEIIWLLLGNPTRNSGAFYEAVFGRARHLWKSWVLDTREIEGTNKAQLQEWCDYYGEDSSWFRTHVRGLPPHSDEGQFIDRRLIEAARERSLPLVLSDEPLVAGCDLAWGGMDSNVIRFRCGMDARSIPPIKIPGELTRDPSILVNRLAEVLTRNFDGRKVAMLFLDSAGIAGPIAARLRAMGFDNVREVNFGAESPDQHYAYYRDYMWGMMRQALVEGLAIDDDKDLALDLAGPLLVSDLKQRVKLESKEFMKKRGLKSPDNGDSLGLTWAAPVGTKKLVSAQTPSLSASERLGDGGWMG
jgi:hypothetical protein